MVRSSFETLPIYLYWLLHSTNSQTVTTSIVIEGLTVIDVPASHRCPSKKNLKIKIKIYYFYFFWSGSLDPTYVHGVKRVGHSQITVAVSTLSNPQVHELLIRCFSTLKLILHCRPAIRLLVELELLTICAPFESLIPIT
jgi:hypothetical protein